ncbi:MULTISPECIES: hypothetical protein [unclassified Variovorax]|uniref:hypothetical protein n=1 Tax=unclassified Variovorax TaxID=663243 RepID=UPI00076CCA5A|nr:MULTISPECIES: hypothetical protein [unclassified Variovorax]KWT72617.1 hypothetical protein APY03_6176 [Variovorax sp. WDL1]PNG58398.1 hypothetical protein CHC07_00123 [Variovorax sp. B4]PNG61812.1 hypothetical protein CHC06_01713 [Variovorax sp. B2]VTV12126.1 hypothetical protein WDL1CHR_02951 [Variovorax sp. WDL1]
MEKIILYVDDAVYARELLSRLTPEAVGTGARRWVLVACAPRMTHRISKWVSHSARENWRNKWLAKTQEQLLPLLQLEGGQVTSVLAKGPLAELTQRLKMEYGAARVIDARRPKIGVDLEPVAPDVKSPSQSGWALPGAMLGMGALLVLANELSE